MNRLDPKIVSFFFAEETIQNEQVLFGGVNRIIQQIYNKGLLQGLSSNDCHYISNNSFFCLW